VHLYDVKVRESRLLNFYFSKNFMIKYNRAGMNFPNLKSNPSFQIPCQIPGKHLSRAQY